MEIVFFERKALPFRQGLDDLGLRSRVLDIKGHLPLIAVQVIIEAGGRLEKKRCADSVQLKRCRKRVCKLTLDHTDRLLGIIHGQKRPVAVRDIDVAHLSIPSFPVILTGKLPVRPIHGYGFNAIPFQLSQLGDVRFAFA